MEAHSLNFYFKLGVAWASSNYVAFDDRLLEPMLEG